METITLGGRADANLPGFRSVVPRQSPRNPCLRSGRQLRILGRSVSINPKRLGDGIWCLALRRSLCDLLANCNPKLRTPDLDAVGLRAGHPGLCTLTDLLRL